MLIHRVRLLAVPIHHPSPWVWLVHFPSSPNRSSLLTSHFQVLNLDAPLHEPCQSRVQLEIHPTPPSQRLSHPSPSASDEIVNPVALDVGLGVASERRRQLCRDGRSIWSKCRDYIVGWVGESFFRERRTTDVRQRSSLRSRSVSPDVRIRGRPTSILSSIGVFLYFYSILSMYFSDSR